MPCFLTARTAPRAAVALSLAGLLLTTACGTATPAASHGNYVSLAAQQQAAPAEAVLLADELARTAVDGDAEHNAAAAESVSRNQAELVDLVTAEGGADAGQDFQAAWQSHVDVLATYATALRKQDTAAQSAARQQYIAAEEQLA